MPKRRRDAYSRKRNFREGASGAVGHLGRIEGRSGARSDRSRRHGRTGSSRSQGGKIMDKGCGGKRNEEVFDQEEMYRLGGGEIELRWGNGLRAKAKRSKTLEGKVCKPTVLTKGEGALADEKRVARGERKLQNHDRRCLGTIVHFGAGGQDGPVERVPRESMRISSLRRIYNVKPSITSEKDGRRRSVS